MSRNHRDFRGSISPYAERKVRFRVNSRSRDADVLFRWQIQGLDRHGRVIERSEPFEATRDQARDALLEQLNTWMSESDLVCGGFAESEALRDPVTGRLRREG